MESITLGQIALGVTFLVGVITGISFLIKKIKEWIIQTLAESFDKIEVEIKEMSDRIENVDLEACKNFLVRFLSDVEKGETIDDIQLERFYEQYRHYTNKGGNSYVKRKVDKLVEQGKL